MLLGAGLVTNIDEGALAVYCTAYARWVEAEEYIQKFGPVMMNHGFPQQSPYLQIANKAMEQMLKVMAEFGMTPSARTRVKAAAPAEKANPLREFLANRD